MKYQWEQMDEQQKIKACKEEINLPTHNGTTKDDLLNILKWLWDKFEVETIKVVKCDEYDEMVEIIDGAPFKLIDCDFCGYETMHKLNDTTTQCNLCGMVKSNS